MKVAVLQEVLSCRPDWKLRVAVVGSEGSGKTSLIRTYLRHREAANKNPGSQSSQAGDMYSFVNSSGNVITSRKDAQETDVECIAFPVDECEVALELWD